jgi:hypothetical protein
MDKLTQIFGDCYVKGKKEFKVLCTGSLIVRGHLPTTIKKKEMTHH